MAAHAVQGVLWLEQLLLEAEPIGLKRVALGEFFGPNRVEVSGGDDPVATYLMSAAEAFAQEGPADVASACTVSRDRLAGLLREVSAQRPVPVLRLTGSQVPLHVYLRTRVLEAVVHGDDVASSVPRLRVPDPPAASLQVCLDVCLELARLRVGGLNVLRGFTRTERGLPDALRVL